MDEFINAISEFYPKRIGFSTNRDKTGPGWIRIDFSIGELKLVNWFSTNWDKYIVRLSPGWEFIFSTTETRNMESSSQG